MEKIWEQLKTGLKKYYESSRLNGILLGLSGGMDSALVVVLATEALGRDKVHALMMKTEHTSDLSLNIADKLQKRHGFSYRVLDIVEEVGLEMKKAREEFGAEPTKITRENLQARIRGLKLMTHANQYGYLVLACGNKSESAMGYCTLYGDTVGGLSPIGDLYKTEVYALANWLNVKYGDFFPQEVITRAPSAELSPGQKDEDSLPPYDKLDGILSSYIEGKRSVAHIIQKGYDAPLVKHVISRYQKSAFKRAKMPPCIQITR